MYRIVALISIFFFLLGCKQGSNTTPTPTPPVTQTGWVKLKPFPGGKRSYGTAFTINGVAYVCSGINYTNSNITGYNDLWQYNPANDSWTQKTNIPYMYTPNDGRRNAFSFVIGGQAYVGGGITATGIGGTDIIGYDPLSNQWTSKNKLSNGQFSISFGTSYKNIGYILSLIGSDYVMYTYNPSSNQIVQTSFMGTYSWCVGASDRLLLGEGIPDVAVYTPGSSVGTFLALYNSTAGYFSIDGTSVFSQPIIYNNNIYQSFGDLGKLFRFDLTTNAWDKIPLTNTTLNIKEGVVCFNIGSKLYVVGGSTNDLHGQYTDAVWMIDLDHI